MKRLLKKSLVAIFAFISFFSLGLVINNNAYLKDINTTGAVTTQTSFTVRFNTVNGSEISSQIVNAGDKITRPENPTKEGHEFVTWKYNGDVWNFENNVVTEDMTLIAYWTKLSYTITFDTNGGSAINAQIIKYGEKIPQPTDSILEGYHIKCWMHNGYIWNFEGYNVKKDMTLVAIWEKDTYTVTFNSNGGSSVDNQRILFEDFAQKPADPMKKGYVLVDWLCDGKAWNFDTDVVKSDVTLIASWTRAEFNVTFDTDGGSVVDNQKVLYEGYATKPTDPTKYGHTFVGWSNSGKTWYFDVSIVTQDVTITAVWEKNNYTVTFYTNGTEEISSQTLKYGDKVEKPSEPFKEGYHVENWYNGSKIWDFETDVINEDMTLVAGWVKNEYTITFDSNGGSVIDNQKVLYQENIIKPKDPILSEKELVCWKNGDIVWNFETDIVIEDLTLTAVWTDALYSITFDSKGGSVIPTQNLKTGSFVEQPTNPTKVGYTFLGWKNGDTIWNFETDTITRDMTLVAEWQIKNFIVDFDVNGGSKVVNIFVQEGKTITKPENPTREGYSFIGWYYKDVEWDFANRIVETNLTLTAVWEEVPQNNEVPNKSLHITIIVISSVIIVVCIVAIVFVVIKKKS